MRLGDFELRESIGKGGMGEVYAAVHVPTGSRVAVKVLSAQWADNEDLKASFREEVRAVAALDHPHIVRVLDFGEVTDEEAATTELSAGIPYMVMELVQGGTLAKKSGKIPWKRLQPLLLDVLEALSHAHARGVTHRDIKGGNILLARRGAVLTDFGIAHVADTGRSAQRTVGEMSSGTPAYMAPEQFRGDWRLFGPSTDLYALGGVTWWLVTRKRPFSGRSFIEAAREHINSPLPPFRPVVDVPVGLEAWLHRCLAKHPRARFELAADAAHALRQLGEPRVFLSTENAADPDAVTRIGTPGEVSPPVVDDVPMTRADAALPPVEAAPFPSKWIRPVTDPLDPAVMLAGLGLFGLRALPFVDRSDARDRLWRLLEQVHTEGRQRAVVIEGGAGSGKSSLAQWFCERAHEVGAATSLTAFHSEHPTPIDGLGPAIARLLRIEAEEFGRSRLIERELRTLGAEDQWEWQLVSQFLDPEQPDPGPLDLASAVRTLLSRVGARRPVILVIDDAQWGADAIKVCKTLLGAAADVPVLVVFTVRSEALRRREVESAILGGVDAERIELGPLEPEYCRELVQRMIHASPELSDRITKRAGGNPLYAVQLLDDWVHRGLLAYGMHGYQLVEGAEPGVPATLASLWATRIDRVLADRSPGDRDALAIAALLGREVDSGEWERALEAFGLPSGRPLLEHLLDRRLARPHPQGLRVGWSFDHRLLRESLVQRIEDPARHHLACAAALEMTGERDAGRRGVHLHLAGAHEQAVEALGVGVAAAMRSNRWDEADRLLNMREASLEAIDAPIDDERWGEVTAYRGELANLRSDYALALEIATRLADQARHHGWAWIEARAEFVLGQRGTFVWEHAQALKHYERAVELLEGREDQESLRLLGRTLQGMGVCSLSNSDLDATIEACGRAREASRRSGNMVGVGAALHIRAAALLYQRRWYEAEEDLEAAAPLYEGARLGKAALFGTRGAVAMRLGDYERAHALYEKGLEIARELECNIEVPLSLGQAYVEMLMGRDDAGALDRLRRVRDQIEGFKAPARTMRADAYLAVALARNGRWYELGVVAKRLQGATEIQPNGDTAEALFDLGQTCIEAGQTDLARSALTLAIDQLERLGAEGPADDVREQLKLVEQG